MALTYESTQIIILLVKGIRIYLHDIIFKYNPRYVEVGMKSIKSRRNVLKALGSSAGLASLPGGVIAASSGREKVQYVGFKYNPRTKEVVSDISARLSRTETALAGKVDLGRYIIPVTASANKVRNVSESATLAADIDERLSSFRFVKRNEYAVGGRPMKVDISSITNGAVTGLVRHSIDQPKEAFMLEPVTGKRTKSQIISDMKAEFRGDA